MRRAFVIGGLLLVALVVRNSVFVQLRLFGGMPELVLLTVVALAFHEGPETGAIVGFVGGFLQDLSSTRTPVGLSCLAFVLVGFLVGIAHAFVIRPGRLLPVGVAALATFGALTTAILAGAVVGQEYLFSTYQLRIAVWSSCYSAVVFPAVLAFVRRVLESAHVERAAAGRLA